MEPFCKYHIKTVENPEGNDCMAHLLERRLNSSVCPYTLDDIKYKKRPDGQIEFYISKTDSELFGACQDFEIIQKIAESLTEKIQDLVQNNS